MLVAILSAFLLIQDAICLERTWSNRLGKILRTIVPDKVWAAERPFIWNSIDVGGRSAIVKLSNNNLLVHSPVNCDNQLKKSLLDISRQKSPAAFIIAPSYEHLKYASQWSSTFPGAKVIGCPGLKEKEPNLPIQLQFGDAIDEMRLSMLNKEVDHIWFDCELNPFTGKPFFNEVVFYHKASKALLITDLFWNYPSSSLPNYAGRMSSIPMNFEENLTPFAHRCGSLAWIKFIGHFINDLW